MLPDADRELIAAAVDAELTPAQEQSFRRLLSQSAEAVALFQQLQAHSRRLRALRRIPAPSSMQATVATRIRSLPKAVPAASRPIVVSAPVEQLTPVSVPSRSARRVGWLPYAIAASALLAVTSGSFWFASRDSREAAEVVEVHRLPKVTEHNTDRAVASAKRTTKQEPEVISTPRVAVAERPVETPSVVAVVEAAPSPRPYGIGDVIGSGSFSDQQEFSTVTVRLPLLVSIVDGDREDIRVKVLDNLSRDHAFRLDLFTRDPHRAAEVFQAAANAAGIKVVVDATAQERMAKKVPSAWVVFVESLSAEDIAKLFAQLAIQTRGDKSLPFGTAHLFPAKLTEQKELRELLGVDPGLWKRPKVAPAGSRAISSNTVDQLTAALNKKDKQSPEKSAVLLTYLPVGGRVPPQMSKEVKQFLERREERKATTIPLMIVIRPVG
ncbi:anti-sigma factor family protein [Fimbriiglobus ruber]|uniref:Uncharacterized protein n=1 Tax=Fimbriiglobus ruber TaxID=1908690 RepID=A0A225ED67_9BACT|nr:hypothetical protein [Fimbriiglobus ruber]OWK47259.1 hypothetical protein FRUB_00958 [Fimbriiglobus ruber]